MDTIDKIRIYRIVSMLAFICLLLIMLCSARAKASWTPTDFNTWRDGDQYMTDVGRLPRNYQKADSTWEEIDTTWQSELTQLGSRSGIPCLRPRRL
jgi:hypothetical protein